MTERTKIGTEQIEQNTPKNIKVLEYDYPYKENTIYTGVIYNPPLIFQGNEKVEIKYLGHRYRVVAKNNKTLQAGSVKKVDHKWSEDIL